MASSRRSTPHPDSIQSHCPRSRVEARTASSPSHVSLCAALPGPGRRIDMREERTMARHRCAAVAVVNNPSQLLFATEAAHYLKIDTSNIEVVTIPTPGADEEAIYGALISKAGYARVRRLPNAVLT